VRLLLAHGADTNQRNNDGLTPLLIATARGHEEVVSCIVGYRDAQGKSPGTGGSWMGLSPRKVAKSLSRGGVLEVFRAYESQFTGHILPVQGAPCVVSWPGV
jgi:ankyrin repeat protein